MEEMHPARPPRRYWFSAWGALVLVIGLGFLLMVAVFAGLPWLAAKKGVDLTDHVIRAFGRVLQLTPVVTIKGDSMVLEKSAIAELAVVQRKTQIVMKYETLWLSSSKVLVVRADFIVKAGFDLNQSFRFNVQQPSREVLVDLPKPRILSVALQNYEVMLSSDGLINKLHTDDQARVIQQMLLKAHADAEHSDIKQEAMQQVDQRLKDLLVDSASKVTVIFSDGPSFHAPAP